MVGDRNRCTEERIRGFHLWEGKMRKHLSHNAYDLIMVIGHTPLFDERFFSVSPLIPFVAIVLLVCLQCTAPRRVWVLAAWI